MTSSGRQPLIEDDILMKNNNNNNNNNRFIINGKIISNIYNPLINFTSGIYLLGILM